MLTWSSPRFTSKYNLTSDQMIDSARQLHDQPFASRVSSELPQTPIASPKTAPTLAPRPATNVDLPSPTAPAQKVSTGRFHCGHIDESGRQCPKRFLSGKERKRHEVRFHYRWRWRCDFEGCGKDYAREDACVRHWVQQHPRAGPCRKTELREPGRQGLERQLERRRKKKRLRRSRAQYDYATSLTNEIDNDDDDDDADDDADDEMNVNDHGLGGYEDAEEYLFSDAMEG
jgi:hypothetical protein